MCLQEEEYEWFKGYKEFSHLVTPHLDASSRILVLGCGNSSLTTDLFCDGFQSLSSVDLSPAVIERMRQRAADKVLYITFPCFRPSHTKRLMLRQHGARPALPGNLEHVAEQCFARWVDDGLATWFELSRKRSTV